MIKRMRIIAGPNGSDKSSLIIDLSTKVKLGYYVNADVIAQQISQKGFIHLEEYGILANQEHILAALNNESNISSIISQHDKDLLKIEHNILVAKNVVSVSIIAAFVAEWIREKLVEAGHSFTFETVMSHPSKLTFLQSAKAKDYRVYFYFVGTEDPAINQERVLGRVEKGGHPVPEERITQRFYRSMGLLKDAIKESNRAYIFDNSGIVLKLILEITEGKAILAKTDKLPAWVNKYVFQG